MKMSHVTIQTDKFNEEVKFYQDFVELSIVRDLHSVGKEIVFLGNDDNSSLIEIINNENSQISGNENISIAFNCSNVEKKREHLMKSGYDVTPILSPMPDVKFFFVTDPAGVRVQFI